MNVVTTKNAGEMPALMKALGEPFAAGCVGWKPARVSGDRAAALAYIDARDVMDRLDTVCEPGGWRDEYDVLPNGTVRCRLWLKVSGEWLAKEDVGGQSDQPDSGDKMKSAFSDALKRAAVKWGIGRYLYHLETAWVDYDAQKKQFRKPPPLPAWALPGGPGRPPSYSLPPHLAAAVTAPDEPAAVKPQPQATTPAAKPPADSVARLVQGYATAKGAEDFKGLEDRRREVWGGLGDAQKASLKAASDETRVRLGLVPAKA